jgi:hypothetical protein
MSIYYFGTKGELARKRPRRRIRIDEKDDAVLVLLDVDLGCSHSL